MSYNLIFQGGEFKMSEAQSLEQFKSHLNLIKSLTGDKAEEEFYQLMEKAKNTFGDLSIHMGQFYYEYAKFLLEKLQQSLDIFNPGALPVGKNQEEESNAIVEDQFEDDSDDCKSEGAKSENNIHQEQDNIEVAKNQSQKSDQPVITENDYQPPSSKKNQKQEVQQNQRQIEEAQQPQDEDDVAICAQNLLCAIKIFQTQKKRIEQEQQSVYTKPQILNWIARCKSRLADLYSYSENYVEAVNIYNEVVEQQTQREGADKNRGLSEIHYMIATTVLYQNKAGCEKIAIQQLIKSAKILLNNLLQINVNDTTIYQLPTLEQIKVDRFAYLPKGSDNQQTKQIKETISLILDKIEDTYEQMGIRDQYEAEKLKSKQEAGLNVFKQLPETANVIKLGTFGNRKKVSTEPLPEVDIKKVKKSP